ncbi:hypothetical protein LAZ67_1005922 [Cordylochernes scorpioides]|uniref:RNase H type-1 domain-containing protein n=1 Tax=Cordylochernes scorpioides TaxID=51811 RepID=A0ABY6K067_9ARAC|nr:hypothetical protein LAZ67_1005922 [Cordylochernes scorpioides]
MRGPFSNFVLDTSIYVSEIVEAVQCPEKRESFLAYPSPRQKILLAQFLEAVIEHTQDMDPSIRRGLKSLFFLVSIQEDRSETRSDKAGRSLACHLEVARRFLWRWLSSLYKLDTLICILQWIPVHVGIEGNEMADELAKEYRKLSQRKEQMSVSDADALAKYKIIKQKIEKIKYVK